LTAKTISIMQPTYLPWLGLFDLMDQADEFVLLDSVQFERHSWQHRNRVKGPNGEVMLSVPVANSGLMTTIQDAKIADGRALTKHARTISQAYARAAHLAPVTDRLFEVLAAPPERLIDLLVPIIELLKDALGITTPISRASALSTSGSKDWLVRSICEARHATDYLAVPGSRHYMDEGSAFAEASIKVSYQQYECREYHQLHGEFIPSLSALDAILNLGPDARETMLAGRLPSASSYMRR
jgi:hypothetical protein